MMTNWIARAMICLTVGLPVLPGIAAGQQQDDQTPWYDREKIRFFWGTWEYFWESGAPLEQVMEELSHLHATVYVNHRLRQDSRELISCYQDEFLGLGDSLLEGAADSVYFDLELARPYGIHCFGSASTHNVPFYAMHLTKTKQLRWAIDQQGEI